MDNNKHIIVLFRIVYANGIYTTLDYLQKLNKEDINFYINYINNILSIKSNDYKKQKIIKITVSHGIRDDKALKKILNNLINQKLYIKIINTINYQ